MKSSIEKTVMRRVYYSYGLSLFGSAFWQGAVLGAAIATFGRLTHVAAIAKNFLDVPIGQVPGYVTDTFINAITHGELLTVLVLLLAVMLSISFVRRIYRVRHWQVQVAQLSPKFE